MVTNDVLIQALEDRRVMDLTLVGKDGRGVHIRRIVGGFKVWAAHLTTEWTVNTAEEAMNVAHNHYFRVRREP